MKAQKHARFHVFSPLSAFQKHPPSPLSSQELEEARQTIESQRSSLQEKEERQQKLVKTMKVARGRIDSLKSEKDQVGENYIHVTFLSDRKPKWVHYLNGSPDSVE